MALIIGLVYIRSALHRLAEPEPPVVGVNRRISRSSPDHQIPLAYYNFFVKRAEIPFYGDANGQAVVDVDVCVLA